VAAGIALVPALALALTACGGSSPKASPTSSTPKAVASTPTSAPMTGPAAEIKTNWETFFNGKTPTAQRIKLLQHGTIFEPVIAAQSKSSLASGASAKVTAVTMVSSTQAKVTYSVLENGTAMLSNQSGEAILSNGTWQVADSSFCTLLAMEAGGKAPSVCSAAG
jgi:hypothetical protein